MPQTGAVTVPSAVEALAGLSAAGWRVTPASGPRPAAERLAGAPAEFVEWASSFSSASNTAETAWFLSAEDYSAPVQSDSVRSGRDTDAFGWDSFRLLSLEAASTPAEALGVEEFWRSHWPLLISVAGHYEFFAVRSDGAVVHGQEPEFEDVTVVAGSLAEFLGDTVALARFTRSD